ncbi:MAG TPA: extracellular solute-binding protein [Roseiflexaceae bacterium]|jgi:multiple sugar transport system substrate-binding protein|nr:extracellular solute-binding protein [Roseiflexaceae bacterium]
MSQQVLDHLYHLPHKRSFDARDAIVKQLAKDYEAANPNIKIDFQPIPYADYFQKIGPHWKRVTARMCSRFLARWCANSMIAGSLRLCQKACTAPLILKTALCHGRSSCSSRKASTLISQPTCNRSWPSTTTICSRKRAFPSKTLETYEDVTDAAQKLTKRDGDTLTQAGVDVAASPYQWYWTFLTTGSPKGIVDPATLKVTYNNEQGYANWQWLTDLVTKQKADSPEFLSGQNRFTLGKAAINMHEYTYAGQLKTTAPDLKFSIHAPPHAAGQPNAAGGTHWALVVSSKSKNKEAAWNWIKFLTSEASQRKWIAGGGELPSLKSLYEDQSLCSDPLIAAGLDSMQYVQPFNCTVTIDWRTQHGVQ